MGVAGRAHVRTRAMTSLVLNCLTRLTYSNALTKLLHRGARGGLHVRVGAPHPLGRHGSSWDPEGGGGRGGARSGRLPFGVGRLQLVLKDEGHLRVEKAPPVLEICAATGGRATARHAARRGGSGTGGW